jgi:2-haloacid dehalogenase
LGQGSAGLAKGRHPQAQEEEALRTGLSLGMTLIDTAESYGSEELSGRVIEFSLESVGLTPSPALCEPLMQKYLDLDLYPEAREALSSLKDYKLAILSNGSPGMLHALTEASGIAHLLAEVISVDLAKTYKPNAAVYALVEPSLKIPKHEISFVSSNSFDVAGAKHFGFNVAWIERGGAQAAPASSNLTPFEFFKLLRGRAETLGYQADFRIRSLSDLPSLLSKPKDRRAQA